jgi:hypothetical protein
MSAMSSTSSASTARADIAVPERLPFLESISWFDRNYRDLAPLDMLRRYEAGRRYKGVLADPSAEEWVFIQALVRRFGSYLDVSCGPTEFPTP